MSIPTYDELMSPVLKLLSDGVERSGEDITNTIADQLNLKLMNYFFEFVLLSYNNILKDLVFSLRIYNILYTYLWLILSNFLFF